MMTRHFKSININYYTICQKKVAKKKWQKTLTFSPFPLPPPHFVINSLPPRSSHDNDDDDDDDDDDETGSAAALGNAGQH